jgi:hypothetical protein
MNRLIAAYKADRSLKNANKLRSHERDHPFCRLMLSMEEDEVVNDAIHQANRGGDRQRPWWMEEV